MMNWLFRTGSAFGKTDRGVLRNEYSRMEFRDSSLKGLNSSQGTPELTIRVDFKKQKQQGCCDNVFQNPELEVRRKRHKTEGSSIQLFGQFLPTNKILAKFSLMGVVLMTSPQIFGAEHGAPSQQAAVQDPIDQAADQMEGMMLHSLYNQMLRAQKLVNAGDDNPFAPSHAEMIFRSMQEQDMINQLAKRRPLGVGSLVARHLRGQAGIGSAVLLESERQNPRPQK